MKTVSTADHEWAVDEQGSGSPVLLVHAFPLDHSVWRYQIDALSSRYRVIAPDLPGFGNTPIGDGALGMGTTAEALSQLLKTLGVDEPIIFAGLSMGGYIGWEFVTRFPDRVSHLIQCDTRAANDTADARENRLQTAKRVQNEGPDFLAQAMPEKLLGPATRESQPTLTDEISQRIRTTDRAGIAAALIGMSERKDMTPVLPEITIPTLMIGGQHDELTPPAEIRSNANAMPAATMVEIASVGHLSPLESPTEVNAAILQFLTR